MPKKALIINPYWDSLGGGERYTASLISHLLKTGWIVDVYWPSDLSTHIKNRFDLDVSSACWQNTTFSPLATVGYKLLFWVSDGSLPVSFCRNTLIHLQFPFTNIEGKSIKNFLKSKLYTFIVNSQFTKSFIDKEFSVNSYVVYPPIDTVRFHSGKKTNTILYVGRFSNLTQHKGQEILIRSFKKIFPLLPQWRLVLAGGTSVGTDSRDFSQLKKQASGFPIDFVTDPSFAALKKLYAESQIFWSASGFGIDQNSQPLKTEHFGISVVEAMSAGCVPIIFKAGGHPEIVDHGQNGFLWTKEDDLISHTLDLVNNHHLARYSQAAIQKSKIFDIVEFNHLFDQIIPL
jgi:glycosyltransferase involved in cell wall biosynthesis